MAEKELTNTIINFGPQHPSAHGVLRLVVELDGEVVERVEPHIGQLHRGTEKLMEYKTYLQNIPFMDRLDYVSPLHSEHAFVLSVEKLLQIEVPRRAQFIRVLFSELSRIAKHMFGLGAMIIDTGAMTPMVWGYEEREKIMGFFEEVSGARMHMNYFCPGGVYKDVPVGLFDKIHEWMQVFPKRIDDIEGLVTENRIFKQRTVNVGGMDPQKAIDLGFSGPNLRATGVAWDIRKSSPYDVYGELDFDIPVGGRGDTYERYLVRVKEIYESLKIVKQCLEKMPEGEVKTDNFRLNNPPKDIMKTSMEALIHHFKLFSEGIYVPKGEVYVPVEAPSGEFGVYLVSEGGVKPYRVKLRSNGFPHLQAIKHLIKGYQLADIPAILGSYDIIFGEIDR